MTDQEKKGYALGYAAGKKYRRKIIKSEESYRRRQAFRMRVFCSILPMAMEQSTWKRGDKKINTVKERIEFAWEIADYSLTNSNL